jgi:ABC-type nitrate/sulfonate/bicarbonate transport system ATPase subunit
MNHEIFSGERMLEVDGLTKHFGIQTVLDGLSFALRKGDRMAISAPSGSGKTTLIKILSGLEEADGGSFSLEAENPVTVFQEPRLFPYMTVEENALLPLKVGGLPRAGQVMERYEAWLAVCGLAPHRGRYPHELSGGMKQKVALVRGFVTDPDFVMLDEPFKSIDAAGKVAIIEQILARHGGVTLLLVTHDAEEARRLARSAMAFRSGPLAGYTLCGAMPPKAASPRAIRPRAIEPRCPDERCRVPSEQVRTYGYLS